MLFVQLSKMPKFQNISIYVSSLVCTVAEYHGTVGEFYTHPLFEIIRHLNLSYMFSDIIHGDDYIVMNVEVDNKAASALL